MLDGVVAQSKYPLAYHITPLHGLLNDPNGLVQFNGKYHVFYQWNPTGTKHINKNWGHMVSDNMVDWERREIALAPSEYYDKDGIYSGSAVVKDGILYLFYTGNVIEEDGTKKSYQCYATSEDGITFDKKGPLFAHPEGFSRHVRDPKVWYSETEAKWFLLLGAQTNELLGTAIWYVSTNLIEWEYLGEILSADSEAYMWECPDLFELDGQWVFLLSPQGLPAKGHQFQNIYHSVYFPVVRAGSKYEMVNEKMLEIDWGFEFYAPQTFEADDGRRILYAWMGVMEPEVEQATPTISEGWIHNLTIPRELQFENGKLKQYPVPELALLRKNKTTYTLSEPWLVASDEYAYELLMDVESEASFTLSIKDGTKLFYDVKDRSLTLERINWLTQQPETRKTLLDQPLTDVHIFIDGSSIEIFSNAGTSVASARFFEEGPFVMRYEGEITGRIDIYELEHKNPLS